jgi:hypothetical protein
MHGARSALLQAASEFCAGETDGVTDDPEKGCVRCHVHVVLLAIDGQRNHEQFLQVVDLSQLMPLGNGENGKFESARFLNFQSEI